MGRFRISMLIVAVCLLFAIDVAGQFQKPGKIRSVGATRTASRPVTPESPGLSATVATPSQAIVPRLMKFSGALRDLTGKPVSGVVDVTFALYSTEAGGNPLWFETQSVQADEQGRYSSLLGVMHTDGLPVDLFTSGEVRWLGVQVGLEAEQQPRVLLVSVPYALKAGDAETLGGKPASAYMLSETQSASSLSSTTAGAAAGSGKNQTTKGRTSSTSPLTACPSMTSSGAATANHLSKFTTACNVEPSGIVEVGGNLGIGTTTPLRRLTLVDNVNKVQFELQSSSATTGPNLFLNNIGVTNGGKFLRSFNGNLQVVNSAYTAVLFTVQDGGNVGIGTTGPPAAKLQVAGNLKISGLGNALVFPDGTVQATAGAGSGGGTITGVIAGTDLTGGGAAGGVTLNLDTTKVPQLVAANNFVGNQSVTGSLSLVASGVGATALDVQATGVTAANTAVHGRADGPDGSGVIGEASNGAAAVGVWGISTSGLAGQFDGDVNVTGTLSKSGGSFKIDHPLDPANQYLSHSFVESPDMMDIYNGNSILDAKGEATIQLPGWFEALNKDFRYQLTALGGPGPNLHVAEEIRSNRFKIAGGNPGMRVSWQVTGIRHDAWADANRIPVETPKPALEKGSYLHPQLFGASAEKSVSRARHPERSEGIR